MRSERMISRDPTICQAARNALTASTPIKGRSMRAKETRRRGRGALACARSSVIGFFPRARAAHLLFEQVPDLLAVGGEFRPVADLEAARTLERDPNLAHDAAGRGAHDDDAVGQIDRLVDIVGDEEDGFAVALPDAQQLRAHHLPDLRIERAERLVHQQDLGLDAERAGDADTLAHSARELMRKMPLEGAQAHHLEMTARDFLARLRRKAFQLEAELDVLQDRAPGQEREILEDERAVPAGRGDLASIEADRAGARPQQRRDQHQERALAAAGGADDGHELAVADREVDIVEGEEILAPRALLIKKAQLVDDEMTHEGGPALRVSSTTRRSS